jgi:hypothetical protein
MVYLKGEPRPQLLLHPRWRCFYVTQLVSWKELGFNSIQELDEIARPWVARDNKNIDAGGRRKILDFGFETGNYEQFFNKQTPIQQKNLLGPRRVELLNSGKVKWEDLVNRTDGKLILLKDLVDG